MRKARAELLWWILPPFVLPTICLPVFLIRAFRRFWGRVLISTLAQPITTFEIDARAAKPTAVSTQRFPRFQTVADTSENVNPLLLVRLFEPPLY